MKSGWRLPGAPAVLLLIAGCTPVALGPAIVTPPPTAPPPAWPTATPWAVRSFDPYSSIEISSDGTWRVILPDGTSQVIDPRDVLGDNVAPTGVAGRVLTFAGEPVRGALIVHHNRAGQPCSQHDVAYMTGARGFFQAPLLPGLCFVAANVRGRWSPEVAVQIDDGRLTFVTLVMP